MGKKNHRLSFEDQLAVKKLMESQRKKIEYETIHNSSKLYVLAAIMALIGVFDVNEDQIVEFIDKFFLQFECLIENYVTFEDIQKQVEIETGLKIQLEE